MDKYTKYARVYPSLASMIMPIILTTILLLNTPIDFLNEYLLVEKIISIFIPTAIIYASIGYAARELFRSTSKSLFQFWLFKEDETQMPTTNLLLWSKTTFSEQKMKILRKKIKEDFNIKLLSDMDEQENNTEARRTIVDVVAQIRNATRNEDILLQYNYEFGFCRNYIGGCVYSILFIFLIGIVNYLYGFINNYIVIICLILGLIFMLIALFSLKKRGVAYAKQLFAVYIDTRINH